MPGSKRTWDDANASMGDDTWGRDSGSLPVPQISRKVKACSACRKHKIKCVMETGPPCKRCSEKNLSCTLNKSLQTLLSERTELSEAVAQDMETMHAGLQRVMQVLQLPAMPALKSAQLASKLGINSQENHDGLNTPTSDEQGEANNDIRDANMQEPRHHRPEDEAGPSCDNSPMMVPEDDKSLPHVPIHSVYRLTKLSALRSPEGSGNGSGKRTSTDNGHQHQADPRKGGEVDDLISRGKLTLENGERLFRLYMDHLDHFMYGIGGRYQTLAELRRTSRILAVCIFTVAALHVDEGERSETTPNGSSSRSLYGICASEFRRLMAASLFSRHVDRDHLRAMCIASYWLSDMSWTLSGYAIRRAAELNLSGQYQRAVQEGAADAMDAVRLWYILYICDQHLSTLYGRRPVIRGDDDPALRGWSAFIRDSPAITDEDRRLASQVALLNIMHSMNEILGDGSNAQDGSTAGELPVSHSRHMASFARQLDRWLSHWSALLPLRHDHIGGFPRKGALLHYHFATLCLHAHVFRASSESVCVSAFRDSASAAVDAATAIIELLIGDPSMQPALVGMPSYMHAMTGYACMFLAKLAMQPSTAVFSEGDSLVSIPLVLGLTTRLVALYRATPVGRWHLVHLMADGLDKVRDTLRKQAEAPATIAGHDMATAATATMRATAATAAPVHGPFFPDFAADLPPSTGAELTPSQTSFHLQPNFLAENNMLFDGSSFLYLTNGPSMFDTMDLSPSSFF